MLNEIEVRGLRRAWLRSTPEQAREYLKSLDDFDVRRFMSNEEAAGYLEGLSMLAAALPGGPPKLVVVKGGPGKAKREGFTAKDVDESTLDEATDHEHEEHGGKRKDAKRTALDHLAEDPKYYVKLKKIEKAIGTKQSEEMKGAKQAKKPSKASGKTVDPSNGKARYQYKGQTPDKGQAGPPAQEGAPAQEGDGGGPPPFDLQELATVLQTTVGSLKVYAKQFKDGNSFTAYIGSHAGAFLRKHHIGPDKLRRLWEQLAHGG